MISAAPMAGLLVLDLSQGIAGPYCGRLLADQGARVLKVEPPHGDWMRGLGPGPGATSTSAIYYNLGKESLVLDLKQPADLGRALTLAAQADVVIESSRPGTMAKLGLGYDAVRARNANVIYLTISGFGQTGPRAADPMTDTVAQAFSGYMSINRGRDGIPHKTDTTVIDAVTGQYAFQAIAMALWPGAKREARHLDVSLMQSAAAILGPKVLEAAFLGQPPQAINPPAGSYRTSDGWIALTLVREEQFRALAREIGEPDLAQDPRFDSFANRAQNLAPLLAVIAAQLARASTAEWVARLTKAGLMASRINEFTDWLTEPQVIAANAAPQTEVLAQTFLPVPHNPGQPAYDRRCPHLGEHTETVLREFGLSEFGLT
ncbi:MAG TPA: CoA transferase [Thermohalobaculum sp.]|nr:CoA transferase [Thermohalobaculum sp.]